MIAIFESRESAKETANAIHMWRQANVPGYWKDANGNIVTTSWANCNLPDEEYDALYKHQTDALWYVPIPGDMPLTSDDPEEVLPYTGGVVDELPNGWRPEGEGL